MYPECGYCRLKFQDASQLLAHVREAHPDIGKQQPMTDARNYDPVPHTLKAGRELDALVAEKVMGWIPYREMVYDGYPTTVFEAPNGRMVNVNGPEPHGTSWSPSTDIADAWEVVEKVGDTFKLEREHGSFYAAFDTVHHAEADTAPLAICLAGLRLKAVQP